MLLQDHDQHSAAERGTRHARQYGADLPGLLEYLPPRDASDLLYKSFVASIHPIIPLLHLPTFDEEYHRFWAWFNECDGRGPPRNILSENPSLLPLLFAVLFAGAVSCPSDALKLQFGHTSRATTSSPLREAAERTQNMVGFPRNPTTYSLTSFLIVQNLLVREEEPLASCSYISVAFRVAQAMGLHRDSSHFGLDPVETEMRRRIWWHIIHTDVMISVPSGLPPSCLSDTIYDTRMIGEVKDSCIGRVEQQLNPDFSGDRAADVQYSSTSDLDVFDVRLMVAVDRYSITSVLRRILRRQFDTTPLTQADFASLKDEVDALDFHISSRIDQVRNISERQTGGHTYEGDFDPSTFVTWAQLLLKLMVHKTYCALFQPLVRETQHPMWARVRPECIDHCQKFVRAFYEMCTSEPFRPYHWLYPGLYQPLNAAVVLLSDLLRSPQSSEAEQSMALIDRLFSLITTSSGVVSEDNGDLVERNLSEGGREAWALLRRPRRKAWEKAGRDPEFLWTEGGGSRSDYSPLIDSSRHAAAEPGLSMVSAEVQTPIAQNSGGLDNSEEGLYKVTSESLVDWDYLSGLDLLQFNWMD
ncbi:hypothetical protein DL769_005880 [Monosporascus sp. CRB-8-3]|nr:hypothetical protein DL769_005880 [Monosporascus sp. CRB-8-3]